MPAPRLAVLVTAVVAAVLAGVVGVRMLSDTPPPASPAEFRDVDEVRQLFAGIPQRGAVLGREDAPVTVVEYIDLKCRPCVAAADDVIPALIAERVRIGDVRLELRPLAFIGPDSTRGAHAAWAASRQKGLWPFVHVLLHNQGDETTPWLTDGMVRDAATVTGLDADRLSRDARLPGAAARLAADRRAAELDDVGAPPYWVVSGPHGRVSVSGANAGRVLDAVAIAAGEVVPDPTATRTTPLP